MEKLFQHSRIEVIKLTKWLDYASGLDPALFVALPLIQRDAIWKPKQIIDLWDTVLRGMPLGSLLVNDLPKDGWIRGVGQTEAKLVPTDVQNSIGLLDGQQRTLALLAGWQWGKNLDLKCRIWVDFGDASGDECLFRLRMTTEFQPFGFQKNEPSSKLLSHERYNARQRLINKMKLEGRLQELAEIEKLQDHELNQDNKRPYYTRPYNSKLPLDIQSLIQQWLAQDAHLTIEQKKNQWRDLVLSDCKKIKHANHISKDISVLENTFDQLGVEAQQDVEKKISRFADSLEKLFTAEIALIKVDVVEQNAEENEKNEPSLAILFKRVGSGGTALSDEDYIYSVIKHHVPEVYRLIAELYRERSIASLMSETNLVMTVIRLALAHTTDRTKIKNVDKLKFNKKEFRKLIMNSTDQNVFFKETFLPMIEAKDSEISIAAQVFDTLNDLLKYRTDQPKDQGFPAYALPLIGRPLLQVLLRWVHMNLERGVSIEILRESRADVLRFSMFWILAVLDKDKASLKSFEILKDHATPDFPAKKMYYTLINDRDLALSLVTPLAIAETPNLKEVWQYPEYPNRILREPHKVLRTGADRFEYADDSASEKKARKIYKEFWGKKRLLLWLQREAVAQLKGTPSSKLDDINTPYDYDHICPSANWSGNQQLSDHEQGSSRRFIGNSIGNMRILESSQNRSDGEVAPIKKLYIDQPEKTEMMKICLNASAIDLAAINDLKQYSIVPDKPRNWGKERAEVFQRFVENRTFHLYERFFYELDFEKWLQEEEPVLDTELQKLNIA